MSSRLDTAVCHQFGAQLPILAFSHSLPVTAAATNAGAIGIWGATRNTPEEIDEGLAWLAARCGGRPYGVDLVLPANVPEHDNRELLETRLPQRPPMSDPDVRWRPRALQVGADPDRRLTLANERLPGTRSGASDRLHHPGWIRTYVSQGAVGLLFLRTFPDDGTAVSIGVGCLFCAAAGVATIRTFHRTGGLRFRSGTVSPHLWRAIVLTSTVAVLGLYSTTVIAIR